MVQIYEIASYATVYADVVRNGDNTITVSFTNATNGECKVLISKIA